MVSHVLSGPTQEALWTNLYKAAAQGALSQARMLGGSLGLSIATIVLNNKLRNGLTGILDPAQIKSLEQALDSISVLNPASQALVERIYTDAFNEQMRICTYVSAAALLAAILTYQKNPPAVAARKKNQNASPEDASEEGNRMDSLVDDGRFQSESDCDEVENAR